VANPALCACNQTRETRVCDRIQLVDPGQTPFDTFAEDLTHIAESGIWLNPYRGIPQIPGIPAIEILLLDTNSAVIECLLELPENGLDDGDMRVASALFLPSSSIAYAQIHAGDQIRICDAETRMEWESDKTESRTTGKESQCLRDESQPEDPSERTVQVDEAITNLQAAEERAAGVPPAPASKSLRERLISWMTGENGEHRRGSRSRFPRLVAYYWTGGSPKAFRVGDIGPRGFYLITEDRWVMGTRILMTLQYTEGDPDSPDNSITVPSKVIRSGPDGVGFEFVASAAVDPWSSRLVPSDKHSRERLMHFLERASCGDREIRVQ
jgi:hypothetical protein